MAEAAAGTRRARTAASKAPKRVAKDSMQPSEDEIRVRAYHLYQRRVAAGMAGDEASDWVEAERELLKSD
jgi:Protein of unknown function (DUF2934)